MVGWIADRKDGNTASSCWEAGLVVIFTLVLAGVDLDRDAP